MKYLKTYEQINIDEPQVGDYVICDDGIYSKNDHRFDVVRDFTTKNIGRIDTYVTGNAYPYTIKYENVPKNIHQWFWQHISRSVDIRDIIVWSKNKEDLEIYLAANKYNL